MSLSLTFFLNTESTYSKVYSVPVNFSEHLKDVTNIEIYLKVNYFVKYTHWCSDISYTILDYWRLFTTDFYGFMKENCEFCANFDIKFAKPLQSLSGTFW